MQITEYGLSGIPVMQASLTASRILNRGGKCALTLDLLPDMEEKEYAITDCKFAPRCPYATDECRKDKPPLTSFGSERKVRCYHALVK